MHQLSSPLIRGALFLILAELMFAGVGALVKHLSETLSQPQLVFFRNLFALVVLLPWLVKHGPAIVKTQRPGLHLIRSLTGLLAMYSFFYVLANMPLAPAMMALHTAPFFVPFVAYFWLKERITAMTTIAMLLGFAGVYLILAPGLGEPGPYAAIALACALLVAFNKCSIRKLSETEPSARIVFYFSAIGTLISAIPLLMAWQPLDATSLLWLAAMGLLAGVGQLLMTRAFQLASPVQIGLLTYTSVVFAAILGLLFWQEAITGGLIFGTLMIIFAANMTIRQRWI